MLDAKIWMIDDKDKIIEEQQTRIQNLEGKNTQLVIQMEQERQKYKDMEKAREKIDAASENAAIIKQKSEIIENQTVMLESKNSKLNHQL